MITHLYTLKLNHKHFMCDEWKCYIKSLYLVLLIIRLIDLKQQPVLTSPICQTNMSPLSASDFLKNTLKE